MDKNMNARTRAIISNMIVRGEDVTDFCAWQLFDKETFYFFGAEK